MKQSDIGLIESLNEEVDKIQRHGCIVPRVEMGTKDFLDTIAIINRQKEKIEEVEEVEAENRGLSICLDSAVKTALEIKSKALTEYVTELEKRLIAGGLGIAFVRTQMYKLLKEMTEGKDE